MMIDLKTIKTFWINMSSNTERNSDMKALFERLGMKNTEHFEGIVLDPNSHIKDGSGMATHTLLSKILDENQFPCLILEDDVQELTNNFKRYFDVPDDCDALYLGVSTAGARGANSVATVLNDDYFRVWNMLATHAVVYFSRKYVEELLKRGKWFLDNNIPYDIGIGEIHCHFNVLTPTYPVFYQSDPHGKAKHPVELCTRYQLHPQHSSVKYIKFQNGSSIYERHFNIG